MEMGTTGPINGAEGDDDGDNDSNSAHWMLKTWTQSLGWPGVNYQRRLQ